MKNFYAKSVLEKEYILKLNNPDIRIVSFDVFDTLAMRSVDEPTDIFIKMGERKEVLKSFGSSIHFKNMRVQAEKEARKVNLSVEDITLNQIYKKLPVNKSEASKLMKIELEVENDNLHINPQIENWIELAVKNRKKVILVSDMYLSSNHIEKIVISKLRKPQSISKIYVSSEYKKTKHFGTLYPTILKEEKVKSKNILHIGDNERSDIFMASSSKIESIFYSPDKYMIDISNMEKKYANLGYPTLNHHYRKWATLLNQYESKDERFYFNEGAYLFGPILWSFSLWVEKIAKENKIDTIFFVMREGRVFKKCLDMIRPNLNIKLLYASRKSTILPAIASNIEKYRKFDIDNFQFRNFTVQDFFNLFELDFRKSGLKNYKEIEFIELKEGNNYNILNLLHELYEEKIEHIISISNKQKNMFTDYCKQLGVSKKSMLIDFGGGGTIIKNINDSLTKDMRPSLNALFYAHEFSHAKVIQYKTVTFFYNSKVCELLCHNPKILETLFNGIESTTSTYRLLNKKIEPVIMLMDEKIKGMKTMINAFDAGVEVFFKLAKIHGIISSPHDMKLLSLNLSRLIEVPIFREVEQYGNLLHEEGHGSKTIQTIVSDEQIAFVKEMGIKNYYHEVRKDLFYQDDYMTWHQGVISKIEPEFISDMLSLNVRCKNKAAIKKIVKALDKNKDIKEVYVYGAGEFGVLCMQELNQRNIKIKGVIDSKAGLKKIDFLGFNVNKLDSANLDNDDVILVASRAFATEITGNIKKSVSEIKLKIINCDNGLIEI